MYDSNMLKNTAMVSIYVYFVLILEVVYSYRYHKLSIQYFDKLYESKIQYNGRPSYQSYKILNKLQLSANDELLLNVNEIQYNEIWFEKYFSSKNFTMDDVTNMKENKFIEDKNSTNRIEINEDPQNNVNAKKIDNIEVNDVKSTVSKNTNQKIPLPFMEVESLGLKGRWIESQGNYILKPKSDLKPYGVIHFIGGAFAGAAPHLTYKYLLECLVEEGYLVVATPYRLELDYVQICDSILVKFDSVARELAAEYGPLPVIGIGHSAGALLQTLITSLFPDTPRAINVLISFNNKPIIEAIPAFNELVVPISKGIMGNSDSSTKLREAFSSFRNYIQDTVEEYSESNIAPLFISKEILPLLKQTMEIVDQIPPLLKAFAEKPDIEFEPTPINTKEVCRRMYRARKTLVLRFQNDNLDESEEIAKVLKESNTIMRMKRPMIEMQVNFKELQGSHITPLTPNLLIDLAQIPSGIFGSSINNPKKIPLPDRLNPKKSEILLNLMRTVDDTNREIIQFLNENIKKTS